jgi:hypothetical protein
MSNFLQKLKFCFSILTILFVLLIAGLNNVSNFTILRSSFNIQVLANQTTTQTPATTQPAQTQQPQTTTTNPTTAPSSSTTTTAPTGTSTQGFGQNLMTFADCDFTSTTSTGMDMVIDCLRSVLIFVAVIAIIAGFLQIVFISIGAFSPGSGVNPYAELKDRLLGFLIGIPFMGASITLLFLLNPATTNLNFLDFAGLNQLIPSVPDMSAENPSGGNLTGEDPDEGGSINNPNNPNDNSNEENNNNTGTNQGNTGNNNGAETPTSEENNNTNTGGTNDTSQGQTGGNSTDQTENDDIISGSEGSDTIFSNDEDDLIDPDNIISEDMGGKDLITINNDESLNYLFENVGKDRYDAIESIYRTWPKFSSILGKHATPKKWGIENVLDLDGTTIMYKCQDLEFYLQPIDQNGNFLGVRNNYTIKVCDGEGLINNYKNFSPWIIKNTDGTFDIEIPSNDFKIPGGYYKIGNGSFITEIE